MSRQVFQAKSVIIGRKPRNQGDQYKTAFVKLYSTNDPLNSEDFPLKEIEVPNTRQVILHNAPVSYFLEGNDLVYENITKVTLDIEDSVVHVHVE